jgi:hypothetical protein
MIYSIKPRLSSQLLAELSTKAIMIHVERKEDIHQLTNAILRCLVESYRHVSLTSALHCQMLWGVDRCEHIVYAALQGNTKVPILVRWTQWKWDSGTPCSLALYTTCGIGHYAMKTVSTPKRTLVEIVIRRIPCFYHTNCTFTRYIWRT